MARTRRWSDVAQEALRLFKLRMSEREIAAHLGVAKSTVTRWKKQGKLPRLVVDNTEDENAPVSDRLTPAAWAAAMRAEYRLDPSDDQLVSLGERALVIANDANAKRSEQLNASRTFLSIDGKLKLVIRNMRAAEAMQQQPAPVAVHAGGPVAVPKRPRPVRRSSVDPRLAVIA